MEIITKPKSIICEVKPMFKVRINPDFFNNVCESAVSHFKELPEPLPWIEPSINMLYLNCVSSFVFNNYFSSIILMGILLEHILRLAIYDKDNTGLGRELDINTLDKLGTISKLIEKAKLDNLIESQDLPWWDKVAKIMRNKSAHYLLPVLLKDFTRDEYIKEEKVREGYHPEYYKLTRKDGEPKAHLLHDWGSFFHKSDYYISRVFIIEGTEKIKLIIKKTNWAPDRRWWKSQEEYYNMFFEFKWDIDNMKNSLNSMYSTRGFIE